MAGLLDSSKTDDSSCTFPPSGTNLNTLIVHNLEEELHLTSNFDEKSTATTCQNVKEGFDLVQGDKQNYDLAILELCMLETEGFEQLKSTLTESNIPIVLTSANLDEEIIKHRVLECGAFDFILKPITEEKLKELYLRICQLRDERRQSRKGQLGCCNDQNQTPAAVDDNNHESSDPAESVYDGDNSEAVDSAAADANAAADQEVQPVSKRPRMVWTDELHAKFVAAVKELGGVLRAMPKKILEKMDKMGEKDLTRENVASHLQKYRKHRKKETERNSQLCHNPSCYQQPYPLRMSDHGISSYPNYHQTINNAARQMQQRGQRQQTVNSSPNPLLQVHRPAAPIQRFAHSHQPMGERGISNSYFGGDHTSYFVQAPVDVPHRQSSLYNHHATTTTMQYHSNNGNDPRIFVPKDNNHSDAYRPHFGSSNIMMSTPMAMYHHSNNSNGLFDYNSIRNMEQQQQMFPSDYSMLPLQSPNNNTGHLEPKVPTLIVSSNGTQMQVDHGTLSSTVTKMQMEYDRLSNGTEIHSTPSSTDTDIQVNHRRASSTNTGMQVNHRREMQDGVQHQLQTNTESGAVFNETSFVTDELNVAQYYLNEQSREAILEEEQHKHKWMSNFYGDDNLA